MSASGGLLAQLSRRSRLLVGVTALLGTAARVSVFATATAVTEERVGVTAALGLVTAGLWLLQRGLSSASRPDVEHDLYRATARSLLEGDVLGVHADDLHRIVWDGEHNARTLVAQTLPALVADAVASAIVVPIVAGSFPPRMLTAALVALAVAMTATAALRGVNARLQSAVLESLQRVNDGVLCVIEARLELVARGAEAEQRRRFEATLDRYRERARRSSLAAAVVGRLPLAAGVAAVALAVLADASAREGLEATVLGRALVLAAAAPPVLGLVLGVSELARAGARVADFVALLARPRRPELARRNAEAPELPGEVAFERVVFAYSEGGRPVLDGVSFRWSPGSPLVVVGPNGSGKSTLLRVLLGLRAPASGSIALGGRALAEIDVVALRRRAVLLPQRPYLGEPYATVRQAMALGGGAASDAEMRATLDRVGIAASLDDRIGELSHGQRQRVALARLLAADASLVLLDEPDANLDRDGIALVVRLVSEMVERGTMVAIAAHTEELAAIPGCRVVLSARGRADSPA